MRVAITTLGCKVNQYDSAVIQERLQSERHSFVPFEDEADLYIINTCTVTDRADWEGRKLMRRAKRMNPNARVLVTGCYAQVSPKEVVAVKGVDYVVGLNRLDELVQFVAQPNSSASLGPAVSVGNPRDEQGVRIVGARGLPGHSRAFLKVEEGCNYSCTYCIIPKARGRSRSVPEDDVLRQVYGLAQEGFKELVITGIHLGSYGRDLVPRSNLTRLLGRIADSGLIPRIRISSLDPREVTDPLLELMSQSEVICPHFHVCLQAGEDGTLRRMRRNYTTDYYRSIVERIREKIPSASLGSDIIVGFPGESEGDFEQSLRYLEEISLTYFHVFPYSTRAGTVAASLPQQVPMPVKKERARQVREVGANKSRKFYREFIGSRVRVLVERPVDESQGLYKGYSRNYLPVVFSTSNREVNGEVEVVLESLDGARLRGRVMETQ